MPESSRMGDEDKIQPGEDPKANGDQTPEEPEEVDIEQLRVELEDARGRAEDTWQKLIRAQADFDNFRKRSDRDLEKAHRYGLEKFASELLNVRDSLELGLGHAHEEADAAKLREGMEMTLKMLTQAMEKFDIEEIDPQGEAFDPEFHQAMTAQENASLPPNTVSAVMQKGYTLNGRLLRPAMVIVSKAPEGAG
ncbi:MAG: nucleotide exchange factor GrpE [Gammaproteobacteria bacterium]|nr:nucleotide exchange factor GrpE [Gammaproteobacteria bacterium]